MIKFSKFAYNEGYDCYVFIKEDGQPEIVYKGKILKQFTKLSNTKRQYYIVDIPNHGENYVHIITKFAFCKDEYYDFKKKHGKKPVVNHIDNNPFNNSLNNLEYTTQSDNILKALH